MARTSPYTLIQPTPAEHPRLRADNEAARLQWLKESLRRGQQWLRVQRSTIDPGLARDVIAGLNATDPGDDAMSDVRSSEVKRSLLEFIAELSNLRAEGQIRTDNKALFDQAAILQQRWRANFTMTRAKLKWKGAIANAAALGTGYLSPYYDPNGRGPGKGEHLLKIYGPDCVIPDGIGPDGDLQQAYVVHLVDETPLHVAQRHFWERAHEIQADRSSPSMWGRVSQRMQAWASPVLNLFGTRDAPPDDAASGPAPTVDIVRSYILDPTINESGETIVKGEPGTRWAYEVPSLGAPIYAGMNERDGTPLMRPANRLDALVYPYRRLGIWCSSALFDDDSSPYWHGLAPIVPIFLEKWPWDPLGTSQLKAVANIERSTTRTMRAIDDSINVRLDPPLIVDETQASDSFGESFNPRKPGQRIRSSLALGKVIDLAVPVEIYNVPEQAYQWVSQLEARIQRYLYANDVTALAKARATPAADTTEKLAELAGQVVKDMLESVELAMVLLGTMQVWNFFEFDTVARRLELLGQDGVTAEDFDYDPGTLIPSHLPGEDRTLPSRYSSNERGRRHCEQFSFYLTPGSAHDMSRITAKQLLVLAKKNGLPIDRWTMAKVFGIANYGPEPEGTHNAQERLMAEQRMEIEKQVQLAQALQAAGIQPQGQPGRPHAGKKPVHTEPKDSGTRPVLSTS